MLRYRPPSPLDYERLARPFHLVEEVGEVPRRLGSRQSPHVDQII